MRLRFTIRDLLWLVVVVALAVGWWLQSANLNRQLKAKPSLRALELELSSVRGENKELKARLRPFEESRTIK